jgi:hypothetical protein
MLRSITIVMTALVVAVGLATTLALVACAPGSTVPAGDPSIRGTITSITPAPSGGSILVEAPGTAEFDYDKASVWVTAETKLLRLDADGKTTRITFDDLAGDQTVDVWFEGPVAESYPVQASAGTVLVRR